jgi:hypothetical protein
MRMNIANKPAIKSLMLRLNVSEFAFVTTFFIIQHPEFYLLELFISLIASVSSSVMVAKLPHAFAISFA